MKTKNILLGILSLITFSSYAQTEKHEKVASKTAVTEFKIETENLDELKTFDWEELERMFEENDSEQNITLAFVYMNKSETDKTKVRVDNFEMKLTGKTSDLDKLMQRFKNSFEKLYEIDGRIIKN